ncbi:MAG: lipopolysaccharide transport periplasmic protein LptA [Burkholderiales bacterium PBB3]|nr:MAG: lipopolysaccharide transport periplasmic protein LptA [Burkholderiales bacterium PBB3]
MKNSHFSLLIGFALTVLPGLALAEKADRNKDMNIESDTLYFDNLKQVNVFTGAVTLTKGTIQIRGAKLETREDPEGFQFGLVTGSAASPAFFRQKRDGVDEFIEGEGEVIEYDGRTDTVKFIKKAVVRRLRGAVVADEITGGLVVYNNLADTFSVDGGTSKAVGAVPAGRVRVRMTPKPEGTATGTGAPTSAPVSLKPANTLGGATK